MQITLLLGKCDLQYVVNEFSTSYKKRKLKVMIEKNKGMILREGRLD